MTSARTKTTFLLGFVAGYVLGARAGRQRYEQIRQWAAQAWRNPAVQEAVDTASTQAMTAATTVKHAVGDKLRRGDLPEAYPQDGLVVDTGRL